MIANTRAIPTGNLGYVDFLAPGILAQSALFSAIFFGIAVIWERDLGVLHKYLVSPAARSALVTGKALAGGLRSLVQAAMVYIVALVIGVHLRLDPLSLVGVALVVVIGSAAFATFSLVIACLVRTRERFMGIGQVLTMPLFFASSAIYPIAIMPDWLKVVAQVNPLTYQVDALRGLMVQGAVESFPLALDFAVLIAIDGRPDRDRGPAVPAPGAVGPSRARLRSGSAGRLPAASVSGRRSCRAFGPPAEEIVRSARSFSASTRSRAAKTSPQARRSIATRALARSSSS